jgi:hypothetical protein
MRRPVMVLLVTIAIGMLGTQAASAAVTSTITIHWDATAERFHGRVSASNAECEADRIVRLFKATTDGRVLQGKTHTSVAGRWHIEVMHAHGHYFAKTPKQTVMGVVCGGDRSATIDVM